MYQGPVPAILRMPLLLVTSRFDGRLTRLSMLAAYAVRAVLAIIQLGWRTRWRRAVRDRSAGSRPRAWPGSSCSARAWSSLLFLGAKPWVYHEALLWGAALALASFAALVGWLTARPTVVVGTGVGRRVRRSRAAQPTIGRIGPCSRSVWSRCASCSRTAASHGSHPPCVGVGGRGRAGGRPASDRVRRRSTRPSSTRRSSCPPTPRCSSSSTRSGRPRSRPTTARCSDSSSHPRSRGRSSGPTPSGSSGASSRSSGSPRTDRRRSATWSSPSGTGPRASRRPSRCSSCWPSSGRSRSIVPDRLAPGSKIRRLRAPVLGAAAGGAGVLVLGYMANRYLSDTLPLLLVTGLVGAGRGHPVGRRAEPSGSGALARGSGRCSRCGARG